jgi:putative DNA primase/helicase
MSIDIRELKNNVDIVQVIGSYGVELKKSGPRWVARCPFHSENSASFTVTGGKKPRYKCFGCDAGGDVIDFVIHYGGKTFQEAIKLLQDPNNTAAQVPGFKPEPAQLREVTTWTPIEPRAPFKTPPTKHYEYGLPSKVWYYRNALGHPVCLVCRFDLPGGKKAVWPYTYCTDGKGREEWRWKGLDPPRPLYNLHLLSMRPNEPVMLGEGEKTADAMHSLFPEYTCSTWIGGGNGARNTDLSPLYGRDILLWPDNDKDKTYENGKRKGEVMDWWDQPGNKTMLQVYAMLKDHCPNIRWIKSPADAPCGWDVADIDWTIEEANAYLQENIIPIPVPEPNQPIILQPPPLPEVDEDTGLITEPAAAIPEDIKKPVTAKKKNQVDLTIVKNDVEDIAPADPGSELPPDNPDSKKPKGFIDGGWFRMLGYQKDVNVNLYHFYSYKSKSVISLSPSAMTKPNLLQLAPLDWWEGYFPRYGKDGQVGGFELDRAQDWLINKSVTCRVFNSKWIRGRGAWIDGKHVVIHSGEHLIVDGVAQSFEKFKSKYIYEIGEDMGFNLPEPLTTKQSSVLLDILDLVNWSREIDAYLLAGWCVVAPICGALPWRPHIWITGGAGTGKSWIFQFLVRRLLGESALAVQGETTEPGLRQLLKHDALPVVFDEAEGEDRKSQERMAGVIGLMRSSSASDGGIQAMGTSGGRANTYRIRSCFAFASIAYQVTHQSDRTRITLLQLKKPTDNKQKEERWKQLQKKYHDTVTEEYSERLRSRTISMLPVILENARTFSSAAAAELGQQRAGDQVGVLLAGAYSLRSSKIISYKEALKWIKTKDWSEEKAQEQTRDELALIEHILGQTTRIESSHGVQERTIGELVRLAYGIHSDKALDPEEANNRLGRIGIKVAGQYLVIGNSVDTINKFLAGTHWAKNYNKILARLDGAIDSEPTRFASGMKIRATKIPLKILFMNEQGNLFDTSTPKIEPPGPGIIMADPDDKEKLPF